MLLLLLAAALVVGLGIKYVPWLALPVVVVGLVCSLRSQRARAAVWKHFESRGVTIDRFERITKSDQKRLGLPKDAWVIHYHDDEAVQYWAAAVRRKGKVEVLQDAPRQVYEAGKPEWKEGDEIDLEVIKELANPSDARRYFLAAVLQALRGGRRELVFSEGEKLPGVPGAPMPVSLASVVQCVQIAGHTAESTGSAEMLADGEELVLDFTWRGEPGHRTLTLILNPPGSRAGQP